MSARLADPQDPLAPTDLILAAVQAASERDIDQVIMGLTWTASVSGERVGFAQTPGHPGRSLSWSGDLAGQAAFVLSDRLASWEFCEAAVGLSACNAVINHADNPVLRSARPLEDPVAHPANLAVFAHFKPALAGKKIAVIGRYPGLDAVLDGLDVTVLERAPGPGDLPDPAAECVLPQTDVVFLTGTSLINKTFARLAWLSRDAVTVFMGPSVPWLADWQAFGIDFLAGVGLRDHARALRIVSEGGGTRLFEQGVRYALADIGLERMAGLKQDIAACAAARSALMSEMAAWFETAQAAGRSPTPFPKAPALDALTEDLSRLDTRFKRQWDIRSALGLPTP